MAYAEWTGIAISSWPKKSFWNPSEPGLIIPATDGVSLPTENKKRQNDIKALNDKFCVNILRKKENIEKNQPSCDAHHRGSQNQASAELGVACSYRIMLGWCVKIAVQWPWLCAKLTRPAQIKILVSTITIIVSILSSIQMKKIRIFERM